MNADKMKQQLQTLSPEVPWAHWFEFAPGVYSVTRENEKFYKKALGLKQIGDLLVEIAEMQVRGHSLTNKRVLDLASGEGAHSIAFARKGAKVLGMEGRRLYIERARFAAEVMQQSNVEFVQGDVREIDPQLGTFDVVVFSGILHHLGLDDFDGMVAELGRLTSDLLLIYTHVSTEQSVKNHRLQGPAKTARGREGYLFREHADNASVAEREQQVRASLDNTFSFWVKEEHLLDTLKSAGFPLILKVMVPHVFGWEGASYRPILVAKKRT